MLTWFISSLVTGKTLAENVQNCPPLAEGQVGCFLSFYPCHFLFRKHCLWGQHYELYNSLFSIFQDIIRSLENPIKQTGHLQILCGNLAPEGSVAKITGKEGLYFSGNISVYDFMYLVMIFMFYVQMHLWLIIKSIGNSNVIEHSLSSRSCPCFWGRGSYDWSYLGESNEF